MPCIGMNLKGKAKAERQRIIALALDSLERALANGSARVTVGANGAVAFSGAWPNRSGMTDVCAVRALQARHSDVLAQAIAATGRQVNPQAVAAGIHSHDGGQTWHAGH